ncbi:MAG TPA: MFS transporter [Terriglobales bacterium]|nr:MFS transporter [Terriglobales bacterium]
MRWRILLALALAELLAISPWFSGTAAASELRLLWGWDPLRASWITVAVQLGFVAGALVSAWCNLSDVFPAPRVMLVSALLAAAANWSFGALVAHGPAAALTARFFTGVFLAGVYPAGMKILAGWFREGRGTALGVMVGALTIGTASPYALRALAAGERLPWQPVIQSSTVGTLLGAAIIALFIKEGPFAAPAARFDIHQAGETFRNRRLLLANAGYWGHMWELYAMWAYLGILMVPRYDASHSGFIELLSRTQWWAFAAIAMGAFGCLAAGVWADRDAISRLRQRSNVTIAAMVISGLCCLVGAALVHRTDWFAAVALVWGFSVVADSAQFSAIVSEVSDPRYVGTALTMQTATGFALTAVSLQAFGWMLGRGHIREAIASLALGPVVGIWAMWRLKQLSAAETSA